MCARKMARLLCFGCGACTLRLVPFSVYPGCCFSGAPGLSGTASTDLLEQEGRHRKEQDMSSQQGDVSLLEHPLAQELLHAPIPARLAYTWKDGTPRVVPIWFHWTGQELVLGSPPKAPKVLILPDHPQVALTIDSNDWPYKTLLIRGIASIQTVEGVAPEYAAAAERYFGEAQGRAWVEQVRAMSAQMTRIAVRPTWVGLLDFQTRFPSAIEAAMAGA